MKQTKCTLAELNSEEAVRVMNQENQHILKGGDWGDDDGCCQYPPTGISGGGWGNSWSNFWSWLAGWYSNK